MMDAAIDYAEAARNARDLAKLAKLASEPIVKTIKEAGKPREEVITTQEKEGSLGSAKEYAERSYQEVLGASVALLPNHLLAATLDYHRLVHGDDGRALYVMLDVNVIQMLDILVGSVPALILDSSGYRSNGGCSCGCTRRSRWHGQN